MNQISALNNPWGVDTPLTKSTRLASLSLFLYLSFSLSLFSLSLFLFLLLSISLYFIMI